MARPLPPKLAAWQSVAVGTGIFFVAGLLRFGLAYVVPGNLVLVVCLVGVVLAAYIAGALGGLIVLAGPVILSLFAWLDSTDPPSVAVALIGDSVFAIAGTVVLLAVVALRGAIFELAERDERARLINRELTHRNCNLFAITTTLAAQTMKRAGIDGGLTASLRDRITALARAQELISLEPGQGISLERLVERVLAPIVPEPSRLIVEGGPVGIPGGQVTGLAMTLNELGTNALKYGAWSEDSGRVTVSWQRTPLDIAITWQERGGPPISVPDTSGFGSVLIERAIPGACVDRSFEPAGLMVVLRVPLESGRRIPR